MRTYFLRLVLVVASYSALLGQTSALRGVVTDETGGVVPGATLRLRGAQGIELTAISASDGSYAFAGLAAGSYALQVSAPQLSLPGPLPVVIQAGTQTLSIRLGVASTTQQISVDDNPGPAVGTGAESNATATVLQGEDLAALSDNVEDLESDLQALAGPSAGPGGGSIFVDGFSGGQLPPKESIREIRINQNPFSPEFDKLGLGRIEIFTKPGADKYRASLNFNFANDFWNSRNPYSGQKAPLALVEFENTLGGPLGKRASFTLDANQNNVDNGAIINAVTLDPVTLNTQPLLDVNKTIQRRTRLDPRVDYQLNENNTLTVHYGYTHGDIQGSGIGGFNLVSRGYRTHYNINVFQVTETSVHGALANETRLQYYRNSLQLLANSQGPMLQVLNSFNGGASTLGQNHDTQNNFEGQNNTTAVYGRHTWRAGIRVRTQSDNNTAPQNFNGTFVFGGGIAPALNASNKPVLDSSGQPVLEQISSIERYRRTILFQRMGLPFADIAALGGGATQFSMNAGNPKLSASQTDVGVYAGDDWRLRPNLTLDLGLRYEAQTNLGDGRNVAPRAGVAWAPRGSNRSKPALVVRGGFGLFYDRLGLNQTMSAMRYNGVREQQYVVNSPAFFPNIPTAGELAQSKLPQTIQALSPALKASYIMQSAVTVERQLLKDTTLAATYTNSRGVRMLRSVDTNAPLPGTYNAKVSGSGVFPLGHTGPVFILESSGKYDQHQLIVNVNSRLTQTISLFGSYVLNRASSDTDGSGTVPANPYSMAGEYGPSSHDVRHRVNVGGSINTRWNIRLSPLVSLQSGSPFDITAGSDLFGTTLFNGRPGIATDPTRLGLVKTEYGLLDPNPIPGEAILSRNYGRGPGQMMVNLRVAKAFGFGKESRPAKSGGIFAAPGERRYSLICSLSARNLLNHTNPGPIIGNITSPLFGRANQMQGTVNGEGFSENANNRRLEAQLRFTF